MGLSCSGELSDLAFYGLVEKSHFEEKAARQTQGLLWYGRFKDDILMLFSGDRLARLSTLRAMRARAKFFKIEFERFREDEVTMLDVRLFKGARFRATGKLDFACHRKDTQIWAPLSPTSAHPSHVHLNWPSGMVKRIKGLCSQSSEGRAQARIFLESLDMGCSSEQARPRNRNRNRTTPFSRLILPYHSVWDRMGTQSIVEEASSRHGVQHESFAAVGCGWKLMHEHVGQRIQGFNRSLHEDADRDASVYTIWR